MTSAFSLRPYERLKKKGQFQKVYKNGRPAKGEHFNIIVFPTKFAYNRVGFSLESKKIKSASKRTRVKRLLREVYRLNKSRLDKAFDIVVIAKSTAQNLDFSQTQKDILNLFHKADLIKSE